MRTGVNFCKMQTKSLSFENHNLLFIKLNLYLALVLHNPFEYFFITEIEVNGY